MDLYFLGSGSEKNYQHPRRKNTSLLITSSAGNTIVDVGDAFPDSWNEIRQIHPDLEFPSVLIFSHAHQDHIKSLPAYFHYAEVEGVDKPTIYITEQERENLERSLYWIDLSKKSNLHLVRKGESAHIHNEDYHWIQTVHGDREPLGFRLRSTLYFPDFNGEIPNLGELAEGISRIIMECNNYHFSKSGRHNSVETILQNKDQWRALNAEEIILTHLGDEMPIVEGEISKIESLLSDELGTKVSFSYDLMVIRID